MIWTADGQIYTRNHFIFMNKRWDMLQAQSEGPGFKSRRRRWDSSVRQTANGPCLGRLSCINEYKVFLRCLPVYGGTTSATICWCNAASPEVFRKKHLFPGTWKRLLGLTKAANAILDKLSQANNPCVTVHLMASIALPILTYSIEAFSLSSLMLS